MRGAAGGCRIAIGAGGMLGLYLIGWLFQAMFLADPILMAADCGNTFLRLGSNEGSGDSSSSSSNTAVANIDMDPADIMNLPDFVGSGQVDCAELQANAKSGDLRDPNAGEMYSRELRLKPAFQMSVHNEQYDPVRWKTIYKKGRYYEGHVHDRFVKILEGHPNSILLDVGANIGYFTLLTKSLGQHNKVVSFEVNPLNILRLCESLDLNQWQSDVAIFHNGVFNKHGEKLMIDIPAENPGKASLMTHTTKRNKGSGTYTTTVTLDQFAQERNWFVDRDLKIAILKIDVEGREPAIIEGAATLLKSGLVENILTELRDLKKDEKVKAALQTILEAGYVLVNYDAKKGGNKKMTTEETDAEIQQMLQTAKGRGTVDLWFQREELPNPF